MRTDLEHFTRSRGALLALLALIASALPACEAPGPATRQQKILVDPGPWVERTDAAPPRLSEAGVPLPRGAILVPAGDDEPEVYAGEAQGLSVILLDRWGEPVEGESIRFEIIDLGSGPARLSARRARTDVGGLATVTLHAGDAAREYTVEATHSDARSVRFTIHVVEAPVGGLEISFEYLGSSRPSFGPIEFYLLEDDHACERSYPLEAPEEFMRSGTSEVPFESIIVEPLPAGRRLSILAKQRFPSGGLSGAGCVDEILIEEGALTRVRVAVYGFVLDPAGAYEVVHHLDLEGAAPREITRVAEALIEFFGDERAERPITRVLFDLTQALTREAAGDLDEAVAGLAQGWIEDKLLDLIGRWFEAEAPGWAREFSTTERELLRALSDLEVHSEVKLWLSNGRLEGTQDWRRIAFYWTPPCGGARDEACRHEIDLEATGQPPITARFSGLLSPDHDYNLGIIRAHNVELQYGRLILFVLKQIVLPEIADGATSFSEALPRVADCGAFARQLTGGGGPLSLGGAQIADEVALEGWCLDAMRLAGELADGIAEDLYVNTHLRLQGTVFFWDETGDLTADRLEGDWEGVMRPFEGGQGAPFQGAFYGESP